MFNRIMNLRNKSVAVSWLGSYLLILLIPMLISVIIFSQSDKTLQSEISRAKLGMLRQVQQLMDSRLGDARKLTVQMGLNQDIQSIMYARSPLDKSQNMTILRIVKDLVAYKQANTFIDDFYIYLKNSSTCLTPTTYIEGRFLFDSIHEKTSEMTYEDWLGIVNNTSSSQYISMTQQNYDQTPQRVIAYIQPIPLESRSSSAATAVILMNESRFNEVLQNVQLENEGDVLILNKDNKIMASNHHVDIPSFLTYDALTQKTGTVYHNLNGKKIVVSYTSSEVTNWKYISITPVNLFMRNAVSIRNLIIFGSFLCLFIGILVIYILLKKNYHGMSELVQSVSSKSGLPVSKNLNEYGFIQEALVSTIKKHDKTNEKLAKQTLLLRSHFLAKLLKGRTAENLDIDDILASYSLHFESQDFAVMLVNIDDYSQFFPEGDKTPKEERIKLVQFIITNVVEELCNENNTGIMIEVDDMLACLINFKKDHVQQGKQIILNIADKAVKFIYENFQILFTVAIGGIHQNVSSITVSYHEALDAMEYKIIMEDSRIIHYDDIKNPNHHYNYSYETEHQLINIIKAGDFENAKILLDQIFENNFYRERLSVQMAKCLLFDLVSTMLKTIDQIGNVLDKSFMDALKPADLLLECQTVKEMKDQIESILQQVCDYIKQQRKDENNKLSLEVIHFIENYYSDMNLNVSMLGDHFNLTASYLSKLFKEQTGGESLANCINRIRLEKAKQLLAAQNNSIEEIALQTGYTSSAVFIRTFKKYEGITPGKYKELKFAE